MFRLAKNRQIAFCPLSKTSRVSSLSPARLQLLTNSSPTEHREGKNGE